MNAIVETLLAQTAEALAGRRLPEATYRLQFHAGFTFRAAAALTPYLRDLGVTHCHASPYLKARTGSQHGYDITDHRQLNPEIGSDEDYAAWTDALAASGLEQILDTVPNHMAVVGNDNQWWNDVLENGLASPYAEFFDIAWGVSIRPELQGRVLVPILGEPYGKALESQQLRLNYAAGSFTLTYFDHRFPIAPRSYRQILGHRQEELVRVLGPDAPPLLEYQSILTAVKNLPLRTETNPARLTERQREKEVIKRRLAALTAENPAVADFLEQTIALFNGQAGDPRSFDLMEHLLDDQAYRLANWRVASDEINYRRFFDINELAALSMERDEVFAATHERILRLLAEGKASGLRIDHPDGLYDPVKYLRRLQEEFVLGKARAIFEARPEYQGLDWKELVEPLRRGTRGENSEERDEGREAKGSQQPDLPRAPTISPVSSPLAPRPSPLTPLYVVVEKILTADEALPDDWPTHGTSGYDFLNFVNGLFIDGGNAVAFTKLYREWTQDDTPFGEVAYQKKTLILQIALSSELQMLTRQLDRLAQNNRWSRDFTLQSLRRALREVIACFPVYRSYLADGAIHEADRKYIQRAIRRAMVRNPALSSDLFHFIRDMLLNSPETSPEDNAHHAERRRFAGKFQQVTAPVMAKGVEDTAFYVYNRLLSLNEVGGDPDRFGVPPGVLHRFLEQRQARWAWAISATATHDTKRSEDARARINVLSEIPSEWAQCVARWSVINEPRKITLEDGPAPDANEEYFIYQTLLGAWPMDPYAPEEFNGFVARIQAYLRKALQEAKTHTSWINPNSTYDEAVKEFLARILSPETGRAFLDDFRPFQRRISHYGLFNSLSQTLLKITAPGVPELYQGTELWDFSLVDPDNRRPVDYERRQKLLNELKSYGEGQRRQLVGDLMAHREDGRIKLYLTWRALTCGRDHPGLFTSGEYLPVEACGPKQEHVFSYLRRQDSHIALVVVPRLLTRLAPEGQTPCAPEVWEETVLPLPAIAEGRRWINLFTGETHNPRAEGGQATLPLSEIFAHFPVALLYAEFQ